MRIKQFKRYIAVMLAITTVLAFTACAGKENETSEETGSVEQQTSENSVAPAESTPDVSADAAMKEDLAFPIGQALNGGSFTGTAYLAPMIANEDVYNFPQTNNVTFEPGARSGWHSHGGMVIIVTGGVGYYQEEGRPRSSVRVILLSAPLGSGTGTALRRTAGFPKW